MNMRLWMQGMAGLALAALTACASTSAPPTPMDRPPKYLRVSATASAVVPEALASQGHWIVAEGPEWTARVVEPIPETVPGRSPNNPGQALLMARAAARRSALRALGGRIPLVEDTAGRRLSDALPDHPAHVKALNQWMETAATVRFEDENGACLATATLPPEKLAAFLDERIPAGGRGYTHLSAIERTHLKPETRRAATARLREEIARQIDDLMLSDGRALKDLLDDNPWGRARLEEDLAALEPDEVHYDDDGVCEAVVFYDVNRAVDRALHTPSLWQRIAGP